MRPRAFALAAVLACPLALPSCALWKSSADEEQPVTETMLTVENRHWSNVTVYVMRGKARVRMGTVTSMNTMRFVIPAVIVNNVVDIRLVADPLGADPFTSEPIVVGPGDHVEFRLTHQLVQSSIWVR